MIHSCYDYLSKILKKALQDFKNNLDPLWHQLCTYLKRQKNIKKGAGRKKASGRKNERHEEVQEDSDMTLSPLCRSSAARYAGNSAVAAPSRAPVHCTADLVLARTATADRAPRIASYHQQTAVTQHRLSHRVARLPLKLLKLVYLQVVKAARDETLRSSQTASEDRPHWCFSSLLPALQNFFSILFFFSLSVFPKLSAKKGPKIQALKSPKVSGDGLHRPCVE